MKEFMELDNIHAFVKVAMLANIIIKFKNFLFAQHFSFLFYIDISKLSNSERMILYRAVGDKIVEVKDIQKVSTLVDFISQQAGQ